MHIDKYKNLRKTQDIVLRNKFIVYYHLKSTFETM